jgi:hypothetical protein
MNPRYWTLRLPSRRSTDDSRSNAFAELRTGSLPCPSDKPQVDKNWIGCGVPRFSLDPILYQGQTLGRLMDVVVIGNVTKGPQKLLQAFDPGSNGRPQHFLGEAIRIALQ